MTSRPKPRVWRGAPLPAAAIREASAAGESDVDLARRYNASPSTISRIVRGETHPDAGGPTRPPSRQVRSDGEIATVSVEMPVALRDRIDRARGRESRMSWIRRASETFLVAPTPGDDPGT